MAFGAWLTWRETWDQAQVEVERSAVAVAQYGERVLALHAVAAGRMNVILRGLSDGEIRGREAELHAELEQLAREIPHTEAGFVIDRHGAVLVSANVYPVPREGTPGADRDFFLALSAADPPEIHVSRLHVGRLDGALFFAVSRRRERTGNGDPPGTFEGLVNLSIFPDQLAHGLRDLTQDDTDIAGLVRTDGEVLARSPAMTVPVRLGDGLLRPLGNRAAAVSIQARSAVDGQDYLVAARLIEGWPVYGMAGRPLAAVVAAWRRAVAYQLAIGLPATFMLIGLAFAVRQGSRRLAAANDQLEQRVAARTAELADSARRLQEALRVGRVLAFEFDPAAGRVVRSPNAGEILGQAETEAVTDTREGFFAAVHPDDRERVRVALAGSTPAQPRYQVRFRYIRPDGGVVWLQDQGAGQFGPDGRLLRLTSLARDVTAEMAAEEAMRDAEQRLRAATEGAGLGTYEIDFRRDRAWFDARAVEVTGGVLPAATWFALDGPEWAALAAIIHPEDRAAFEQAWSDVVRGAADGWAVETRLRRPDGSWGWDWCHGTVTERDPATLRPRRLVGIVQDVTDRRRLEAELRQGQKLQALGSLAGGIAHDFNNVLQAVSGAAAMLRREAGDPARVRHRTRMLAEAVERGAAITGRLLGFARRTEARATPLDVAELLQGLKEILGPTLGAGIEIRVEALPGLPPLLAEREQLQTALINLATNARDAMPRGGVLILSAAAERVTRRGAGVPAGLEPGEYLRLSVRDDGTGMGAATLARAADPFFTTKPEGQGTGLGLPMAKGLAAQLGGAFLIESAPGKGTTVTLWLPGASRRAPGSAAPAPAEGGLTAAPGPERRLRILVVDDDRLVRETLADELTAAGHGVCVAPGGAEALALLDAGERVDALVADLSMPGLDGLSLIQAVRRRYAALACVLLTGHTEGSAAALAPDAGGGEFALLHKPATGAEVAAALGTLQRAEPA
ncbi:PAS domain-containing protein [Falsiroseomonas sp.]|uniref:PAS domain-containing protein n=1 Tax=Falsiroseomonas sp. TaxID=2870721 RepID=UPI003561F2B7